jgi:Methyltransferase domain
MRASFELSARRWSALADDYYPVEFKPRWGHGAPSHSKINAVLSSEIPKFKLLLADIKKYSSHFKKVSFIETGHREPFWDNMWFSTLDAAALMYFLLSTNPTTYMEVGSGFSTRFARRAISDGGLKTKLISIDPKPRVEIDSICDLVIRSPLEKLDLGVYESLESGDIAFFDGSHRIFTNSDTTVFFLEAMPRLKPGVLVHIHDIFWPDDYTPEWNNRLYSEQYVLGAMMLSGMSNLDIVLPNYFVSTNTETSHLVADLGIPIRYSGTTKPGLSFWLRVK